MKKLAAISLLALFFFNLAGYRIWFYYAQYTADVQLEASLDKEEYNEDELITIKVPLSLPYQTNWNDFERVDGEINLDGTIYKYVKRKVSNGELILLCLPDHQKMHLQTAKDTFFKFANDLQNATSKKTANNIAFKNVCSDFECQKNEWFSVFIETAKKYDSPRNIYSVIPGTHTSLEQPPDLQAV